MYRIMLFYESKMLQKSLTTTVQGAKQTWTIKGSEFKNITDGEYMIYFDGLNVGQMSETVYATVYNGSDIVSNTVSYSIESYVYSKLAEQDLDKNLKTMLEEMIKYGYSAHNYVNAE